MPTDDFHTPADFPVGSLSRATLNEQVPDNILALFNALDGDGQATGEVIHRHKVGTLANKPAPGEDGRIYRVSDMGLWLADDGTSWHPFAPIPGLCEEWRDEAIADSDTGTNETIGQMAVVMTNSGTVTAPNAQNGIYRLSTGATNNSDVKIRPRAGATSNYWGLVAARLPALLVMKVDAVNDADSGQAMFCGLRKNSFPDGNNVPSDGFFIRKLGAANWNAVYTSGGVERSTDDLGIADALITVYIELLSPTSVNVYINTYDNSPDASWTTNLSTELMGIGYHIANTGAADRQLDYYSTAWYAARS